MSTPTRDCEPLALALHIQFWHGADGPRVIAEKIGAFALTGKTEAVELWREVARRYEGLIAGRASLRRGRVTVTTRRVGRLIYRGRFRSRRST
ncbi:DUF6961 family protein [Tsuneonella sp. SYSU-LHT278]|uniref:DUF6961 family protein n=1 Tax=Tsuneonella sediminis TaxID=3416089 RepID=UPI003F7A3A7E